MLMLRLARLPVRRRISKRELKVLAGSQVSLSLPHHRISKRELKAAIAVHRLTDSFLSLWISKRELKVCSWVAISCCKVSGISKRELKAPTLRLTEHQNPIIMESQKENWKSAVASLASSRYETTNLKKRIESLIRCLRRSYTCWPHESQKENWKISSKHLIPSYAMMYGISKRELKVLSTFATVTLYPRIGRISKRELKDYWYAESLGQCAVDIGISKRELKAYMLKIFGGFLPGFFESQKENWKFIGILNFSPPMITDRISKRELKVLDGGLDPEKPRFLESQKENWKASVGYAVAVNAVVCWISKRELKE